jgi:type III restriction enzyme
MAATSAYSFAQLEAAETIIFLTEARLDLLQGIDVPLDEPSEERRAEGYAAFRRCACKMATGTGKTTVMGMLAAWSILNKVNGRSDARFSDVVLVVCPNVTIRNRLAELDPEAGEASLYRTRDLVPSHLMPLLSQGRVLITNWHVFEPHGIQVTGTGAKVVKAGKPVRVPERITIGERTTTARGTRYLTEEDLNRFVAAGLIQVLGEERDRQGKVGPRNSETSIIRLCSAPCKRLSKDRRFNAA